MNVSNNVSKNVEIAATDQQNECPRIIWVSGKSVKWEVGRFAHFLMSDFRKITKSVKSGKSTENENKNKHAAKSAKRAGTGHDSDTGAIAEAIGICMWWDGGAKAQLQRLIRGRTVVNRNSSVGWFAQGHFRSSVCVFLSKLNRQTTSSGVATKWFTGHRIEQRRERESAIDFTRKIVCFEHETDPKMRPRCTRCPTDLLCRN